MADAASASTRSFHEHEKTPLQSGPDASPVSASGTPHVLDGGARAWSTMLGGFLVYMATFGYANAFGVFQDYYTRAGTSSASNISWIGGVQLFLLISVGLISGKLLDQGYFRVTTWVGTVLYVFSLFMVSIAHPNKYYQLFLSQGVGMGLGAGLIYVPAVAVQAHHFRVYRPVAVGVVNTGSSIGGIIFPIMLNRLINGRLGFAWGVRATAFVTLGVLIAANLLMSSHPAVTSRERPPKNVRALFTDKTYMLLILGGLFMLWGLFYPYFYLQLFAIKHGVEPTVAFYSLAILNAGSIPGRIVPNLFARRIGVFNSVIACCFVCGGLLFALYGVRSVAGTVVFSIIYGFFSGAFLSLVTLAISTLAKDESEIGVRVGLGFALAAVGALTGNPIVGALLGDDFSWGKTIVFSAVSILSGTAVIFIGRLFLAKEKGSHFV
ncbi:unnamed protein product [Peniophora sp. CBMAI 1063]|nr:unnamed protein product [Peniophora sp. CBMAI 1063]